MANRHYDERKGRKLKKNGPPPKTDMGSGSTKRFDKESSVPYSGAPGPIGHGFKQGQGKFDAVKTSVKKDY